MKRSIHLVLFSLVMAFTSSAFAEGGPSNNQNGALSCPLKVLYYGFSPERKVVNKFGVTTANIEDIDVLLKEKGYEHSSSDETEYAIVISEYSDLGPYITTNHVKGDLVRFAPGTRPYNVEQARWVVEDPKLRTVFAHQYGKYHHFGYSSSTLGSLAGDAVKNDEKDHVDLAAKLPNCNEIIEEINKERVSRQEAVSVLKEKAAQPAEVPPSDAQTNETQTDQLN